MSSSSVRMSNARLKHDLGTALRYPSYRAWLDEQLRPTEQETFIEADHETAVGAL
jgi:hypothetical protein